VDKLNRTVEKENSAVDWLCWLDDNGGRLNEVVWQDNVHIPLIAILRQMGFCAGEASCQKTHHNEG